MSINNTVSYFESTEKMNGKSHIIFGIGKNFSDIEDGDLEYIAVKSINTALKYDDYALECFMKNKTMADKYFNILNDILRIGDRYPLAKKAINYSKEEITFKNGSRLKVSY